MRAKRLITYNKAQEIKVLGKRLKARGDFLALNKTVKHRTEFCILLSLSKYCTTKQSEMPQGKEYCARDARGIAKMQNSPKVKGHTSVTYIYVIGSNGKANFECNFLLARCKARKKACNTVDMTL